MIDCMYNGNRVSLFRLIYPLFNFFFFVSSSLQRLFPFIGLGNVYLMTTAPFVEVKRMCDNQSIVAQEKEALSVLKPVAAPCPMMTELSSTMSWENSNPFWLGACKGVCGPLRRLLGTINLDSRLFIFNLPCEARCHLSLRTFAVSG